MLKYIIFVCVTALLAYEEGVAQGRLQIPKQPPAPSFEEQILANQDFTRSVCTTWWFRMNHTQRSVK